MTAPGTLDASPSSTAGGARSDSRRPWPRRAICTGCGDEILKAKLDLTKPGRPIILEVREVVPAYRCERCHGRGIVGGRRFRRECALCFGTGNLGELVGDNERFLAIDAYGFARHAALADRRTGEALHRRHDCPRTLARAAEDLQRRIDGDERPLDAVLLDYLG